MANGCYAVVVLIPQRSDLTPERAVLHFSSHWFRRPNLGLGTADVQPVRAEVLSILDSHIAEGFRVWYGDWSISAWLESGPSVVADHLHLAAGSDLPATSDVVASCQERLSVESDVDTPQFDNSDLFTEFLDQLRMRFGGLVYDPVEAQWWV